MWLDDMLMAPRSSIHRVSVYLLSGARALLVNRRGLVLRVNAPHRGQGYLLRSLSTMRRS
jgi:hypothetical protein